MRVLIVGIGGFVGQYLKDEFVGQGYEVLGTDIEVDLAKKLDVPVYKADILDENEITELIKKTSPNIIVNLAAISSVGQSWKNPKQAALVNVIGSLNIIEAARKLENVPKILLVGSSEEYQSTDQLIDETMPLESNSPYGITKISQEMFAKIYRERYDMQIYNVRSFNHTGIGQSEDFVLPSFCKQVADIEKSGKAGKIKVGNLAAKRDFSDVRDVVRAYRLIVESNHYGKVFNVGSGLAYELNELLKYIISLSNQDITVEVDPERFRPVDTPIVCCNNKYIQEQLGWNPQYSIFETLKKMFEYYVNG